MTERNDANDAGEAEDGDVLDLEALFGDGVTLGDANEPYEPWDESQDADAEADDSDSADDLDDIQDGGFQQAFLAQLGGLAGAAGMPGGWPAAGSDGAEAAARVETGDLVRVRPNGAFGLVLGGNDDATFDVELLGPDEDEYDVRVPQAGLMPQQEMEPEGLTASALGGSLLFARFAVTWGIDVDRSFTACLGRNEQGMLELWYEGGRARARKVRTWGAEDVGPQKMLEALATLCSRLCEPAPASPALDACRWSAALFFRGDQACSCEGCVDDAESEAAMPLKSLITGLAAAGCSCEWKDGVGPCNISAS